MNQIIPPPKMLLITFFFIFGCASTPMPVSHEYSTQKKMQAAHHWDVLANDVAQQVIIRLKDADLNNRPVYVRQVLDTSLSEFTQGFQDLLLTHLVNHGLKVLTEKDEKALIVEYKAQAIYHKSSRTAGKTGKLALLTAGILVIRDAFKYGEAVEQIAAVAGTVLGISAIDELTARPHSEVIMTTSVLDKSTYILRKTDIYYINDEDFWHYTPPMAKRIKVVD